MANPITRLQQSRLARKVLFSIEFNQFLADTDFQKFLAATNPFSQMIAMLRLQGLVGEGLVGLMVIVMIKVVIDEGKVFNSDVFGAHPAFTNTFNAKPAYQTLVNSTSFVQFWASPEAHDLVNILHRLF